MAKKTPLQLALERGLADGADLFEALNDLGQYQIESLEDAEALVDALESYVRADRAARNVFGLSSAGFVVPVGDRNQSVSISDPAAFLF